MNKPKEKMFECVWCRDEALEPSKKYIMPVDQIGGRDETTGLPICIGCADGAAEGDAFDDAFDDWNDEMREAVAGEMIANQCPNCHGTGHESYIVGGFRPSFKHSRGPHQPARHKCNGTRHIDE